MQTNLYSKNGSAIINPLLGLKPDKLGSEGYNTDRQRILPYGYAITGDNLQRNPSDELDQLQSKRGNPGQLRGILTSDQIMKSQTYKVSKEIFSRHGGKITEQAKAGVNAPG